MELSGLQVKDICGIIKACNSANVSSLKLGQLEITFQPKVVPTCAESTVPTESFTQALNSGSKEIELPTSLATEADQQVLEDLQRSQLMMDDPVAFEALMVDDHMERQRVAHSGVGRAQ